MEFGYVGINYKNANQDVRDKVSFTDNQKIDFMQKASELGVEQCMVLSTCNPQRGILLGGTDRGGSKII